MKRFPLCLAAAAVISGAGVLASGSSALAAPLLRQQQIAAATGVEPGALSGARVYNRPIHDGPFAACEWVRVATANGARWRPNCD